MAERPAPPKRHVLPQYGYRINETGAEWWGHLDLAYDGGNSTRRNQVVKYAEEAVETARRLGVPLTFTVLRRDHLTTTWSRFLPVVVEEVRRA